MGEQKLETRIVEMFEKRNGFLNHSTEFLGDKVLEFYVYEAVEKGCYYYGVMDSTSLLTVGSFREDLDDISAEQMLKKIAGNIEKSLENSKVCLAGEFGENAALQPIVFRIDSKGKELFSDSKELKMINSDVFDWIEELKIMKTIKVSAKQAESYQLEYEKIMSADLIPHNSEDAKDLSGAMCVISFVAAVISIFFYEMCVFPVITVVSGVFSTYRCYTNKNYKGCVVSAISLLIGIVFTYIGWKEFKLF